MTFASFFKGFRQPRAWMPYLVLALTLLLTLAASRYVAATTEAQDRLRFENAVQRTRDDIEARLDAYVAMLRAGTGLFAAEEEMSLEEFRAFVRRLELEQQYPGIQGIGFSARVRPEERAQLVAELRSQGLEDFRFHPEGERAEHHAIVYLEPLDVRNRAAIGYDMFSEPVRREAMARARDTASPAASGRVTLVQEIDESKQAGFLIYVPVYRGGTEPATVDERREELRGFVYSPFRADDLLRGIFGTERNPIVNFQVYDGAEPSPEHLLHDSSLLRAAAQQEGAFTPRFTSTQRLDVEGRPWTIVFNTHPDAELASGGWLAPYILVGGIIFSVLLFMLTRSEAASRRRAEEVAANLRSSESRFRTVIEQSPVSTQIFAPDGRTIRVNRAWEELWGATLEQMGGYNVLEDKQLVEKGLMPYILRGFAGEAVSIPPIIYDPEETLPGITKHEDPRRWVQAVLYPVRDEEGRVREVVLMHDDITERVRAEREREHLLEREREARERAEESLRLRREVEERLQTLVQASGSLLGSPRIDAVLPAILRLSRRLISADAYAIWRHWEAEGRWEVVAAEGLSDEYTASRIAVTDKTPRMSDAPLVVEDVFVESRLAERAEQYRREGIRSLLSLPLKVRGQFVGSLAFYFREHHSFNEMEVDVATALANLSVSAIGTAELYDEQRELRASAETARARASFLAEATTALASSLDYEKTLEAVARLAVPQIADWCAVDVATEEGVAPKRLAVAHVDAEKVALAQELHERYPYDMNEPRGVPNVLRTGRSELYPDISDQILVEAAKDDEHLSTLRRLGFKSAMVVPFITGERVMGAITFVTAESERRYTEEDLAFAEDLARRAAMSIENARLYRDAQEANRLKDEFLATLSHELRTPLTSVLGWAKLLRADRLSPQITARALESIERNAEAQAGLINDLLDVSRIITGKLRLNVRPITLAPVIEAAVDSVRHAAEARAIRLDVRLDAAREPVSGDPDRLQQVVWNLLSNAIKFTPREGRVSVRLQRRNGSVEVSVTDTGRGIPTEFIPHVFERFRQADGAITREHGGLGLGLAIARHLVELHGGTIRAESGGRNRGATFTIELPVQETHDDEGVAVRSEAPKPSDVRAARGGRAPALEDLRVLIVDDDRDARVFLAAVLESAGARVESARSASEALEAYTRERPDVFVADIGMPGEDGYELMRKIRALDDDDGGGAAARRVPSIALTAYARTEDRELALAAGFDVHIAKPFVPSTLTGAVARLAGRGTTAGEDNGEPS